MEIFKSIKGYEGLYEISDKGRVRSNYNRLSGSRILKNMLANNGYYMVFLYKGGKGKHITVHSLVAEAFLGYVRDGKRDFVVDHIDKDKLNNHLENLRIVSQRFNSSRRKGSSNFTGVSLCKNSKKWRSQININKKKWFLGHFTTEAEAAKEYNRALNEYLSGKELTRPSLIKNNKT